MSKRCAEDAGTEDAGGSEQSRALLRPIIITFEEAKRAREEKVRLACAPGNVLQAGLDLSAKMGEAPPIRFWHSLFPDMKTWEVAARLDASRKRKATEDPDES